MKLPSLKYLSGEARGSLERFPLVMTGAFVAAAFGIIATEADDATPFIRVMVVSQLAFPLFFALTAAGELRGWSRTMRAASNGIGVVGLIAYHASLPDEMNPATVTRFLQLNVGLHLLVAFLPFARGGRDNGFWQYNRVLFLRFLTALLYTAVVYLGLALALLALDRLLGLPVPDRAFLWLLIVTLFVFNTWVFVGGVPRELAGLDEAKDYPRSLKVFAQYILIPLVIIYLTILTAYLIKVVVTTEWPSGWIGWMVSSVAVVGILALLLVWPVATRTENLWVVTYTRWFFLFMIPSIVMLLLATYKRIDQYGVTENRYFLAVLSVWLAAIAVYFITSRARRIKVIPITLCLVAFATSFGPWGAYTVARKSQEERLEQLMKANGILVDGAIVKSQDGVSFEDRRELSAVTLYLVEHHGKETFDRWIDPAEIDTVESDVNYGRNRNVARNIVFTMGLEFVESWARAPGREGNFNYVMERGKRVFELEGADYMVRLTSKEDTYELAETGVVIGWEDPDGVVLRDGAGLVVVASVDTLFARIDRQLAWNDRAMPADLMRVSAEDERARLTVYFTMLGGKVQQRRTTVIHFNADCFVTLR